MKVTEAIRHAIVTRPTHQGMGLCELLRQHHFTVNHIPSIIIEPIEQTDSFDDTLIKLAQADIGIVTSANAVPACHMYWSKLTSPPQHLIAMGPSTKQSLENAGIPVTHVPAHYSTEGVLAHPICQTLQDKKIVILSGEGGKTTLMDVMRNAGANVDKIALYRRLCPPPLSAEQLNHLADVPSLIIFTSFDSLTHWHTMVPESFHPWLLKQQTLVISTTLQDQALSLGFALKPWLADNATDQSILRCIQHQFSLRKAS